MTAPITWAQATSPILWSNIGIDWDTPAVTGDPTFALSQGYPSSSVAAYAPSITFAVNSGYTSSSVLATTGTATYAITNSFTSSGGFTFTGEATFASTMDYASATTHNAVGVATLAVSVDCINNTDYSDSATMALNMEQPSSSGFLWNNVDTITTTWTDVDYPN